MKITKTKVDDQGYIKVSISGQNTAKTAEILNSGWGLYKETDSTWIIPHHMYFAFKGAAELTEQFV